MDTRWTTIRASLSAVSAEGTTAPSSTVSLDQPGPRLEVRVRSASLGGSPSAVTLGVWRYDCVGISGSAVPVYLLDELVRYTPEGIYLTSIKQNGDQVVVAGGELLSDGMEVRAVRGVDVYRGGGSPAAADGGTRVAH